MTPPIDRPSIPHPTDQLAPYLLGELDVVADTAVAAHLERCEACLADLARLEAGLIAAVESLPTAEPPPSTWAGIEARIRTARPPAQARPRPGGARPPDATAHPRSAAASRPRTAPPGRGGRPDPRRRVVGIASGLLVFALLAGWGFLQRQWAERSLVGVTAAAAQLEAVRDELAAQRRLTEALLGDQATLATWLARDDVAIGRVPDPADPLEALGTVLFGAAGEVLVIMRDGPGEGRAFQAWGVAGDAVVSLGVFEGRTLEADADGYDAVAISLEPPGGSATPTEVLGAATPG